MFSIKTVYGLSPTEATVLEWFFKEKVNTWVTSFDVVDQFDFSIVKANQTLTKMVKKEVLYRERYKSQSDRRVRYRYLLVYKTPYLYLKSWYDKWKEKLKSEYFRRR